MDKKNVKFVYSFDYRELAYEILDFIPRIGESVVINGTAWEVKRVKYDLEIINNTGGDQITVELV